jgi:four helix bundle protein
LVTGQGFRGLIAWQKAMDLVESVYRATQHWPSEETYGLTNQVRRAAVSVPANIAEGQGRNSRQEFARFLAIARGSLCEVETHLLIAQRLTYLNEQNTDVLIGQATEVGRLLHGLRQSLQTEIGSATTR